MKYNYFFEMYCDLLKNESIFFILICFFTGYIATFDAKADLYKFTDTDGRVYYTDEPKRSGWKRIGGRSDPTTVTTTSDAEYRIKEVDEEIKSLSQEGHNLILTTPENYFSQYSSDFVEKLNNHQLKLVGSYNGLKSGYGS